MKDKTIRRPQPPYSSQRSEEVWTINDSNGIIDLPGRPSPPGSHSYRGNITKLSSVQKTQTFLFSGQMVQEDEWCNFPRIKFQFTSNGGITNLVFAHIALAKSCGISYLTRLEVTMI